MEVVVDKILRVLPDEKTFKHLVVNAHGVMFPKLPKNAPNKHIVIHLGGGISFKDHEQWDRLKGKFKYIWFQNCMVGGDGTFAGEVARRTQAIVTAYFTDTADAPRSIAARHIDLFMSSLLVWDWRKIKPNEDPIIATGERTFWSDSRYATGANLSESLDFNMIKVFSAA